MRISHRYKFIFLSNPRCGSTSIRKMLDPYSDVFSEDAGEWYHHIRAMDLRETFVRKGWDWDNYYKFCVIRNPWDRMYSAYKFGKMHSGSIWRRIGEESGDFRGFVCHPETFRQALRNIDYFAKDCNGDWLVDKVIRLEELNSHLPPILEHLQLDAKKILHVNTSTTTMPFWLKCVLERVKPRKNVGIMSEDNSADTWEPIGAKMKEEYDKETAGIVKNRFYSDIEYGKYRL